MDKSAPRISPQSGRLVGGRYQLDALIGSGSTGHVFRATRVDSGAAVAIKLLHPHLGDDRHATLRFRREARVAAAIRHPNWVNAIEFGRDEDGTWFFAMELVAGRVLATLMREEQPLAFPRIHRLFRQMLDALEVAHARGLVHRDLKPGNIIVVTAPNGHELVKVCDFGISKLTADSGDRDDETLRADATTDGAICGTPAYMSPEQARGLPVDARTDVYAATVMLFEMVTGRLPFSGGTKMDVLASHLTELPPALSDLRADLPLGIEDVVRRGLAKMREARYANAAELRDALDQVFSGRWAPQPETVQIPLSPAVAPLPRAIAPPRSNHRALWAVAGAALLLSSGAGWLWHRRQDAPPAPEVVTEAPPPSPMRPAGSPSTSVSAGSGESSLAEREPPLRTPAPFAIDPARASEDDRARRTTAARRTRKTAPSPATGPRAEAAPATAAGSTPPAAPASPSPPVPTSATLLADGERLIAQGRLKDACQRGEEALRLEPDAPAALRFLGRCYMRTGRRADALARYRRYLDVAPEAPDAPLIRSMLE